MRIINRIVLYAGALIASMFFIDDTNPLWLIAWAILVSTVSIITEKGATHD
jgi:hypothetical protein